MMCAKKDLELTGKALHLITELKITQVFNNWNKNAKSDQLLVVNKSLNEDINSNMKVKLQLNDPRFRVNLSPVNNSVSVYLRARKSSSSALTVGRLSLLLTVKCTV